MERGEQISGYDIIRTLGFGAGSVIYEVRDKAGNHFALKRVVRKVAKDQRMIDQAIMEHQVATRFNHAALRKSYQVIKSRSFLRTSEVCVVMELVEGITLEDYQEKISSDKLSCIVDLCAIFQQVAEALGVMHQSGYVHADIKPKNILITSAKKVKLIDFGQSCPTGTIKERIQGTPDFIAPEQVNLDRIMPQTDVFNLGASMYWCLTGKFVPTVLAQKRESNDLAVTGKQHAVNVKELNPKISGALANLVMNCVEENPLRRPPTMADVQGRLTVCIAQLYREMNVTPPNGNGAGAPAAQAPASPGQPGQPAAMRKVTPPLPPGAPGSFATPQIKPVKPLAQPMQPARPPVKDGTTVPGIDIDDLIAESLQEEAQKKPQRDSGKTRNLDPGPKPGRKIFDAEEVDDVEE